MTNVEQTIANTESNEVLDLTRFEEFVSKNSKGYQEIIDDNFNLLS